MKYYIGQEFMNVAPIGAKAWCNIHNAHLQKREGNIVVIVANEQPIFNEQITLQMYENAVQQYLDNTAQSKGYDNTYTCLSYLNSTNETWKTESNIFNAWRDSVWETCHEYLNKYKTGELEFIPISGLIDKLPKIEW